MKGDDAVAKILKMEGVEFITCFPGTDMMEATAKEGIRVITFRSEKQATEAADGFTRISFGKRIGVCATMGGPGITFAFPGIRQAFSDGVPILILTAGDSWRQENTFPNFNTMRIFGEITKYADTPESPDQLQETMRRAFNALRTGRPGPVVVNIPMKVGNGEFDDAQFKYKPVKPARSAGDPDDVKVVAKALIAAKNPLIRAGQGVLYACAWDELRELAELLQIPVYTTTAAKSVFPGNHPLSLGTSGLTQTKMIQHFMGKTDLMFAIGSSCANAPLTAPIPPGTVIMQSTIDDTALNKDHPVEHAIIGDAKLVLRQLIEEVKKQIGPEGRRAKDAITKEIKAIKEEFIKEWQPFLTSEDIPINPFRVVWDLMKVLDARETIVIHASGSSRDILVPFWTCVEQGTYIGYGKDHMLGSGLGLAMGAKLARPDKTVLYMCGDGAWGFEAMDFETEVRQHIPLLNVILNNGVLSSSKARLPIASERYNLQVLTGDYTKMAQALGGYAERVVKPSEIIPAVQRAKNAIDSGTPALLEIIDKEELKFPYGMPGVLPGTARPGQK